MTQTIHSVLVQDRTLAFGGSRASPYLSNGYTALTLGAAYRYW